MIREYPINEFKDLAEKNNWEVYSLEQVRDFASDVVKSIDPTEQERGAIDFVSLNRVVVVDGNFNKSVVYYREPQIEWKDADTETIEKAGMAGLPVKNKIGFYKDTPENRRKGIVGMPYKKDTEYKKKAKEDSEKSDKKED
jgi:hypothetical protein